MSSAIPNVRCRNDQIKIMLLASIFIFCLLFDHVWVFVYLLQIDSGINICPGDVFGFHIKRSKVGRGARNNVFLKTGIRSYLNRNSVFVLGITSYQNRNKVLHAFSSDRYLPYTDSKIIIFDFNSGWALMLLLVIKWNMKLWSVNWILAGPNPSC